MISVVLTLGFLVSAPVEPAAPPNIVLIMIDDLGWMDLACQGNRLVETPNIDRLAGQGMRFTDAYAAAPVCSPTRAAIMTGQAPARLRITNHIPDRPSFSPQKSVLKPAATGDHLPLEKITIAERLKQAGYSTAFMGKWHLSGRHRRGDEGRGDLRFAPEKHGFDINVGGCCYGGPPSYFSPYEIYNLKADKAGEHLPDRLTDEAISFVRKNKTRPFFLCLWNYTVHWPMQAPKHLLDKYAQRKGPGLNDTRYGAMIEAMDSAIGRLIQAIDSADLDRNTLIVFTSDNGGFSGVADNRPLRLGKGYLYEGGIRVPMIVRWTGRVPAGRLCDEPVISTDLYPTFLEIAGLKPTARQPCDGTSLAALFQRKEPLKRKAIYFHYPNYAWHRSNRLGGAIRAGRYKLIENFHDGSVELYDLIEDRREQNDLAKSMKDKASELNRMLDAWQKETGAVMPTRLPDAGPTGD